MRRLVLSLLLTVVSAAGQQSSADEVSRRLDLAFWESVKDSNNPSLYEAYLEKFPAGTFVAIAKSRLQELAGKPATDSGAKAKAQAKETAPAAEELDANGLFLKMQAAVGGAGQLLAVRNYHKVERFKVASFWGDSRSAPTEKTTWCAAGPILRERGTNKDFFDGKDMGWRKQGSRYFKKSDANLQANRRALYYEWFNLMLADRVAGTVFTLVGPYRLQIAGAEGQRAVFEIDPATFLPHKRVVERAGRDAVDVPVGVVYGNWRTVNGIKLPFRLTAELETMKEELTVEKWELNSNVDCGKLGSLPQGVVPGPAPAVVESKKNTMEPIREEPSDSDTSAEGVAMLRRVQEALGGAGRLMSVVDFQREFRSAGEGRKGPKSTDYWCVTGEQLQKVALPFMADMVTFYDGRNAGWVRRGGKRAPMPAAVVEESQRAAFDYDFFHLVLSDRKPGRMVTKAGPAAIRVSETGGSEAVIEVDPATYLPRRKVSRFFGSNKVSAPVEEHFSDWREVNGIKLPFRLEGFRRGSKYREVRVETWKINVGLKCGELGRLE
ncbi:MAG: hypothetical protein JNK48_24550 [Bryobacterales bacterium]|nr:hypothetical protein [Bryobacterales bacterium]